MLDLASVLILLDRAEALLERSLRVDPVEVIEIDAVSSQPAKALFDLRAQDFGPAASRTTDPALRRHDAVCGGWRERRAYRFLALPAGV